MQLMTGALLKQKLVLHTVEVISNPTSVTLYICFLFTYLVLGMFESFITVALGSGCLEHQSYACFEFKSTTFLPVLS